MSQITLETPDATPQKPAPISAGRALFYAIIAALRIGLVISIAIAASTRWAAAGQFGALAGWAARGKDGVQRHLP